MKQTFEPIQWRKSTYSNGQGDCIEIADGLTGLIPVRDSKDPDGPVLAFTPDAWRAFITAIHTGELPTHT
ncbi:MULTISPECIES: DUF397 domain-containing protein [unclassified Streptomyces]|uniref:DUF397 domain-containing protein n=1 Tax=Streptomycetaceae TaxID=2062 RepID=UPI002E770AF0|nr:MULTISPECIES: DUF397 domain-containing protein [unclassified Streptomyces]MED7954205.1 DUF397 domain-containing protein [Streptomyces sp. BE303]MEE1823346.1 DUF397 domain-containing protein [Streptomyces sp. BE20]